MPYNIKVKKAEVADPGFGFILDFSDYNGPAIVQELRVYTIVAAEGNKQYTTDTRLSPINLNRLDKQMTFVIPFGDDLYHAGNLFSFTIEVWGDWPNGVQLLTHNDTIVGQAGKFSLNICN